MPKIRLVIDLATSRVVYFTENLTEALTVDEYTAIAEYGGSLPPGMNLLNCFSYRYVNKELFNASKTAPPAISLLEQNRKTILKFINEKIEEKFVAIGKTRFDVEYHRCLAEEWQKNSTASSYVAAYQQLNGLSTIEDAGQKIEQTLSAYRTSVLNLAMHKENWTSRATAATTSDELFALRDEVFASLEKI